MEKVIQCRTIWGKSLNVVMVGLGLGEFMDLAFRIMEENSYWIVLRIERWFNELWMTIWEERM